jgi:lysophospholipid acyltransferase
MRAYLSGIATTLNTPEDTIILMVCTFACFPLGLINYFIKSPFIRLVFGFVTGFSMQIFMYQGEAIHCLGAVVVTYMYLRFISRTRMSSPTLLMILLMTHLSYLHIRQMLLVDGGWSLEITLIHMILVCKLTSVVYCFEDGLKPDEEFRNDYQKEKKIVEQPSLLEVFSYSYYYSTAVVGPYSEFADFRRFINLEKEFSNIPMFKAMYFSLYEAAYGLISCYLYLGYKGTYYCAFVVTQEFANFNFFYKLFYLNMAMLVNGCKFYIAWKLITATNIFNGMSYEPEERTNSEGENVVEHNFTRIQSAIITKVVFYPNTKDKIESWNHQIHLWLKYQINLRFINNKMAFIQKNRIMLTYFVSAAWHGWYPVYFLAFFDFFIIDRVCEILKKDKFFERLEHSSYILQIVVSMISLHACNYLGVTFALLTIEKVFIFYKSMYFLPNLFVYFSYIYVAFIKGETKSQSRLEPGKKLDLSKVGQEGKKDK